MRFAHFFVDRPIFAAVVSIVIVLLGGISYVSLPVTQYPDITPPSITVSATYPGATAEIAASTVASPLEQQINGVEHMLYMKSESPPTARTSIIDHLRAAAPTSTPPRSWFRTGSRWPSPGFRRGPAPGRRRAQELARPDDGDPPPLAGRLAQQPLRLATTRKTQVLDRLARIQGVGEARLFAERAYAMRVWLDPEKAAVAGPDRRRHRRRAPAQQRPGRRRRARPAADRPAGRLRDSRSTPRAG